MTTNDKKAIDKDKHFIDPTKIQILTIKTIKGNIDAEEGAGMEDVKGHLFNFELGTGMSLEEKVMGIQLTVNIEAVGDQEKPLNIRGAYTHEVIFRVENLPDFVETAEGGEPEINWLLSSTLASIAYSTIRGIIYNRTQGTSLNAVILPVIGPRKLLGLEERKE